MADGGIDQALSKTESVPKARSLNTRYVRNYVESVSMEICTIMNQLGYGEEIRRWRVGKYREYDRLNTPCKAHRSVLTACIITAGSKAEGLTCAYESDWDTLHVQNGIVCVEDGVNLNTIPYDMELFRMDTRVYPGHCKLFHLPRPYKTTNVINKSMLDTGYGDGLLSSGLMLQVLSSKVLSETQNTVGVENQKLAGPSLSMKIGALHTDTVVALPCHCTSILQTWAARHRHWPSPVIVQKVVSLEAYVTPVGFKGSEYKHIEWRICFDTGETELVNNLNDTQVKVYVLLKMILKDVLRPCKKEISSYVIKNIVLLQAERNPQNMFNARSLFHWLHDGLGELRTVIVTRKLPYYMIPDMNLMAANALLDKQQSKWVADITNMMATPRVILRLPKIRQAIVASPEPMLLFSKIRIQLEMLHMESKIRANQFADENGDVEYDAISEKIITRNSDIVVEVAQRMIAEGFDVGNEDLIEIYKRILM